MSGNKQIMLASLKEKMEALLALDQSFQQIEIERQSVRDDFSSRSRQISRNVDDIMAQRSAELSSFKRKTLEKQLSEQRDARLSAYRERERAEQRLSASYRREKEKYSILEQEIRYLVKGILSAAEYAHFVDLLTVEVEEHKPNMIDKLLGRTTPWETRHPPSLWTKVMVCLDTLKKCHHRVLNTWND